MFRLCDATRRQVALGLFVLACALPAAVLVAVGLWRCMPGRVAAEERRLAFLLGQPVRIESVRHLRPTEVLYEGVEIRDPETGAVLLRCDRLRAQLDTVQPKGSDVWHRRLRISAGKLTVTAASTSALRPVADRLLQRRLEQLPGYVELAAKHLVLKDGEQELPFQQIRVGATLLSQHSKVEINLEMTDRDGAHPMYVCLVRNRSYHPPVDGFEIRTGEASLPCQLLATVLPPFPKLGSASRFQGRIIGNRVPEGWEVDVEGNLDNIELRKLVADHIPHELSGTGKLHLQGLAFRAGRITHMRGTLEGKGGGISRALVASCMNRLRLNGSFPPSGSTARMPYDQLAVRFHLDASGLWLAGACNGKPAGAMMLGGYNQWLAGPDPSAGPIPVPIAVSAVTSTPEDELSLSRFATRLLQRLPDVSTAPAATIAAPQTPAPSAVRQ